MPDMAEELGKFHAAVVTGEMETSYVGYTHHNGERTAFLSSTYPGDHILLAADIAVLLADLTETAENHLDADADEIRDAGQQLKRNDPAVVDWLADLDYGDEDQRETLRQAIEMAAEDGGDFSDIEVE